VLNCRRAARTILRKPSILVIAIATTAVLALVPGTAHADPTPPCYGDTCTGLDPQAMGCGGDTAYDVASFTAEDATVILRYSDWCHANWALVITTAGHGEDFDVENTSGEAQYYTVPLNGESWTNMVDGTVLARACLFDGLYCTGWN
jgi:hypothetical protein